MEKRILKLHEALTTGQLIRYRLASDDLTYYGFVVGVGATFALLHSCNADVVCLNGYVAVPLTEMRGVRLLDETEVLTRALLLKGEAPQPQLDILPFDFPGLLSSVNAHFPLLTLHLDRKWPDSCFIGRVDRMSGKSVTLRQIDPQGRWSGTTTYKFKDITRVEFGGGYEDALWKVSEHDRREARDIEKDA